jgi:GT2 family glycosyltransferase
MGYQLGVVPIAHVWHAVGASSNDSQSKNFYFWSARNRFIYASDVGLTRRQLILGRGALNSLRFVASALSQRNSRFTKALAALRGTFAGFKFAGECKKHI